MFDLGIPIVDGTAWFVAKPVLHKSIHWQFAILAVMTALAVITLGWAATMARRQRQAYPVWICLGAAVATVYEPLGDLFAHVTYHELEQIRFVSSFGFSTPLWVLPTYVVFFGATTLWLLTQIQRGLTQARWWLLFACTLPGAWCFEVPLLRMGAISYYGDNQPLQLFGYPLWMAFANSATMFVVATACHALNQTALFQRRPALFIAVLPLLIVGANGASAFPLGSAINSGASASFVELAAIGSMALSLLYVWICGALLSDAPVMRAATDANRRVEQVSV